MQSYIYRSEKKADCYLFLNKPADKFDLPTVVQTIVGELHLVMELEITPETKLSLSNSSTVLEAFEKQGFYIQMPPAKDNPVDALFDRLFDA